MKFIIEDGVKANVKENRLIPCAVACAVPANADKYNVSIPPPPAPMPEETDVIKHIRCVKKE